MTYEDYVRNFTTFEICKINDKYIYSSKKVKHSLEKNYSLIKFMVHEPGEYYFTVCQKDRRQYHNTDYKYSHVRMQLCQIVYGEQGQESLKYLKSEFKTDRETLIHSQNLEPGDYAMLVDIDWTSE